MSISLDGLPTAVKRIVSKREVEIINIRAMYNSY